ncbi:MAG: ABC-2 family transporter protein, partial [Endomicrobium sp.]|nr:ABC-2 family transporter protein [Endomicrobium sp.]
FPMYPEGIFKGITRIVLYSVFPVGLIFYVPVNLLTDFKTTYLFIIPIISTIFIWSAIHIFNLGLKKYSSSCLIGIRL